MLLVAPVDLLTYYSLTCWLVDSLTLNKIGVNWILMDLIGVKIPNSPEVVWWGDDVAAPESVVGIRELWCGDFIYLIPSTLSVNYERGCVLLLRFRLMMA